MKTIYEERYNKALESAKRELESCGTMDCDAARLIFRFFPELAESEDEKISREITEFLADFNNGEYERPNENTIDSWLSWLEKQGETIKIKKGKNYLCTKTHKYAGSEWREGVKYYSPEDYSLVNQGCTYYCPKYSKEEHNNLFEEVKYDGCLEIDNTEPKFKVGDWIANDDSSVVVQIEGVSTSGYYAFKKIKPSISYSAPNCEFVDRWYHLWTIYDAKNGDVLATENFIFIFKNIDIDNGILYYCHYEISNLEDYEQFGIALPQSLMGRVGNAHY